MEKTFTNKADQNIPVLKREQLGKGVRGKYFQQYTQQSNVVVPAGVGKPAGAHVRSSLR